MKARATATTTFRSDVSKANWLLHTSVDEAGRPAYDTGKSENCANRVGQNCQGGKIHERIFTPISSGRSCRGGGLDDVERTSTCSIRVAKGGLACRGVRCAHTFRAAHQAGGARLRHQ